VEDIGLPLYALDPYLMLHRPTAAVCSYQQTHSRTRSDLHMRVMYLICAGY